MSAVIPPLIISALLPFAFDYRSTWFTASEKIHLDLFLIALCFGQCRVKFGGNVLMNKEQLQNRPMKGLHTNLSSDFLRVLPSLSSFLY